eukprot:5868665-Amphidinium_carterae.1
MAAYCSDYDGKSKFQALSESNAQFSAIVAHHIIDTKGKIRQDVESVLAFSIALEAELAALVQDMPSQQRKENPSGMNATPNNDDKNDQSHGMATTPKGQGRDKRGNTEGVSQSSNGQPSSLKCKFFGTPDGCRFGQTCRHSHPYVKPGSGICFVCGSTSHQASVCDKPRKTPGTQPNRGRSTSKPRNEGGQSSGQSKSERSQSGGQHRDRSKGRRMSGSRPPKVLLKMHNLRVV